MLTVAAIGDRLVTAGPVFKDLLRGAGVSDGGVRAHGHSAATRAMAARWAALAPDQVA
jgi:hypothetical protein